MAHTSSPQAQQKYPLALIGYSGHAFVLADAALAAGWQVEAYCEQAEKSLNPFQLRYLGNEHSEETLRELTAFAWAVGIGDNRIRERLQLALAERLYPPATIIHRAATVSPHSTRGQGTLVAAGAVVNPLAIVGHGVILNTNCVVEHECAVGDFAHIGPAAVLTGNVRVGARSFIGSNACVLPGVTIGADVVVGAGSVVRRDVPDGKTVVGLPARSVGRG